MKNPKQYPCRFPGCNFTTTAPAPRGRHESIRHAMKKGVVIASVARLEAPAPLKATAPVFIAKSEIVHAIETIEAQRRVLLEALTIVTNLQEK